ncbi:hypothetical protein ITJ90_000711 [Salmonella enterica]|nr:hypothetical protein [Salmonella enterica]EGO0452051.1 hypothetical protein [Salmonella enterica]
MTPESVMMMGTEAMKVALALAAPLLLVAVFIAIIVAGPWMLNLLLDYVRTLFSNLPYIIG